MAKVANKTTPLYWPQTGAGELILIAGTGQLGDRKSVVGVYQCLAGFPHSGLAPPDSRY